MNGTSPSKDGIINAIGKDNVVAWFIFLLMIIVVFIALMHELDKKVDQECSDRGMQNPPDYCQEYWKERDK